MTLIKCIQTLGNLNSGKNNSVNSIANNNDGINFSGDNQTSFVRPPRGNSCPIAPPPPPTDCGCGGNVTPVDPPHIMLM